MQQPDLDWTEADENVERERAAYIALHAQLVKTHFGKHVAIRGGELIDSDDSVESLYARVKQAYPIGFVLITQVRSEPTRTFRMRSPRLERHH